MADIYGRNPKWNGSFPADTADITFTGLQACNGRQGGGLAGLVLQNLQIGYQQQVSRLYEIGSENFYYVHGRTNGTVSADQVLGPQSICRAFYQKFGDACKVSGNNLSISASAGCFENGRGRITFNAKYCVLVNMSLGIRAADMMINHSFQMMMSSLDYADGHQPGEGPVDLNALFEN